MLTAIEKISVQDIFWSDSNVPRRGLMFFFVVVVFFAFFLLMFFSQCYFSQAKSLLTFDSFFNSKCNTIVIVVQRVTEFYDPNSNISERSRSC